MEFGQVMLAILSAGFGALTIWLFKLDDRIFELTRNVATRTEISERMDRLESKLDKVLLLRKEPLIIEESSNGGNGT